MSGKSPAQRSEVECAIGLGSNLGDRRSRLERAVSMLAETRGVSPCALSGFHETAPVGGPKGQGPYLNAALVLETRLSPHALLEVLQRIERACGRRRELEARHGPRTLDLDLLLYADLVSERGDPIVPHPRMCEREFVLAPLAEIAPDRVHPGRNRTVLELLGELRARNEAQVLR